MKRFARIFLSAIIFGLCSNLALADGAKSPDELALKVKQAITAKDSKTISALYNWEGVDPDIAKQLKESIKYLLEEPARKVEARPLPKDFQAVQELGDKRFKQNLKVEGVITLIYSPDDESAIATMPFGAKNGTYYFSAPIIE